MIRTCEFYRFHHSVKDKLWYTNSMFPSAPLHITDEPKNSHHVFKKDENG